MDKENKSRSRRNLTVGLFAVYFFILVWIILFKMQTDLSILSGVRSLNLIPFGGSAIVNGRVDISEILDNVLIFLPFGLYICMLKPDWSFGKRLLPVLGTSLFLEVMQYILAVGSSDITDLITNTLGGVLGIVLFMLLAKIFKNKTLKILNAFALIATALMVVFIAMLVGFNI
ncbi:MAG: VanZ family protein [Bacillota bacterium]|jgi:glycopeptide antibiotics resistance protein